VRAGRSEGGGGRPELRRMQTVRLERRKKEKGNEKKEKKKGGPKNDPAPGLVTSGFNRGARGMRRRGTRGGGGTGTKNQRKANDHSSKTPAKRGKTGSEMRGKSRENILLGGGGGSRKESYRLRTLWHRTKEDGADGEGEKRNNRKLQRSKLKSAGGKETQKTFLSEL